TFGYIVFGAAGPAAAQIGLTASVVSVLAGALVMVVVSRAKVPTASPSASTALILGTLAVALMRDPALAPATSAGAVALLACTGGTGGAGWLVVVVLGGVRAGRPGGFVAAAGPGGFIDRGGHFDRRPAVAVLPRLPAGKGFPEGIAALFSWQWA